MALPPGIAAKTVTIGIASFFDGTLADGVATITAPVNVIHTPSNRPIFSSTISQRFVDGAASFNLAPTDAAGLNRVDWSYKLNVTVQGALVQPDPIYFTLPTAGPDTVDLDGLVTVPSSAGIPISVEVLTADELDPYTADFVNDPTSATSTALRAAFDAARIGRIGRARRAYAPIPVMSSGAPTITQGTSATITAQPIEPESPNFTSLSGPLKRADIGSWHMLQIDTPAGMPDLEQRFGVGWTFDGQAFEMRIHVGDSSAAAYWLKVDGQWTTATPTLPGGSIGSTYEIKVDFGSTGQREIELWMQQCRFGQVRIGASDSILPLATGGRVLVGYLGDSISGDAAGPAHAFAAWNHIAAKRLGWDNVLLDGIGGTGYLNPGPGGLGGPTIVPLGAGPRVDRMIAAKVDALVFCSGINDNTGVGYTSAQLTTACVNSWTRARAGLPSALIVVVNCFDTSTTLDAGTLSQIAEAQATIRAAAAAHPELVDVFVETQGRIVTTANDSRIWSGGAGIPHPGPVGHELYGRFIAGEISRQLQAA